MIAVVGVILRLRSEIRRKLANVIEARKRAKAVTYLRLSRQIKVLRLRFHLFPKLDVAGSTSVARSVSLRNQGITQVTFAPSGIVVERCRLRSDAHRSPSARQIAIMVESRHQSEASSLTPKLDVTTFVRAKPHGVAQAWAGFRRSAGWGVPVANISTVEITGLPSLPRPVIRR